MNGRWVLLAALLVGCGDGELEAENARLQNELGEMRGQLSKITAEKKALDAKVEQLQAQVESLSGEAKKKKMAQLQEALGLKDGQKLNAKIETRLGSIACELWPEVAPKTVTNFVQLAEGTKEWTDPRTGNRTSEPLYPGTPFHRVIPGFMIQGGDPTGTGRGGPGYRFEDEVTPEVRFDQPGLLAMANAGPGTNGSQFFITDSEPGHLNMRHTIFGKCELPVVKEILAQPHAPGPDRSKPANPVLIDKIVIERL